MPIKKITSTFTGAFMGNKGFSLMEVMIVVVIVGILAAVAIPSYTGYVKRTKRSEAVTALQTVALYQEKHMAERGRYGTIANLIANAGLPDPDGDGVYEPSEYYAITVNLGADNMSFVASAAPAGGFVDNVSGAPLVFAIDSDGRVGTLSGGAVAVNEDLWTTLRP
jgi:prepilin-type N-terminal cleavage/methylation domain-containing protein